MTVPRLIYSGPTDEHASIKRVETEPELVQALASGWRLRRCPDPDQAPEPEPEPDVNDDTPKRKRHHR